ncbi:trypsin-like peptidase domain-containing protein [Candidatus Saccharibacteria bacterium]|nr:trypsin-like peptidase domain-containing protein [Candidatus Saccharibacteria bacterium]
MKPDAKETPSKIEKTPSAKPATVSTKQPKTQVWASSAGRMAGSMKSSVSQQSQRGLLAVVIIVLFAGGAGYMGGVIATNTSNSVITGSLSDQKKIVTNESQLISQISKTVGPSVVSVNASITSTTSDFFGYSQDQTQEGAGTGLIITKTGIIMTNRHVVPAGTSKVSVTLADGTTYDNVKVLGRTNSGDSLDVAFLQISDLKGKQLTPAVLGDSSEAEVGDSVVAIGNALGEFQNTVTSGIISGFGRSVQASSGSSANASSEDLDDLIQTDAAINEGNSGGPLVNLNGQVIGINTAIASNAENIGFSIPINDLKGLIKQVLQTGKLERPYLGIRYVPLTKSIAKQYGLDQTQGAYIVPQSQSYTGQDPILSGSPADKAGLIGGDVITKIDGKTIDTSHSLTSLLNNYLPGDEVHLTVVRNGKTMDITATLGKASS